MGRVLKDCKVARVCKGYPERAEERDPKVSKAGPVLKDCKVARVCKGYRERSEERVPKVYRVGQVQTAPTAHRERRAELVFRVRPARLGALEERAPLDQA